MNLENSKQVGSDSVQKSSSKSYQTGNVTNISNFDTVISFAIGYGDIYNPARVELQLPSLQTLSVNAKVSITNVNNALSLYTIAVTAREEAFMGFNQHVSSVIYTLKALETSKNTIADASRFARKIKGMRAVPKKSLEELKTLAEQNMEVKYNSVAQLGYNSRVENFDQLISLLHTLPNYNPNEAHLSVAGLREKYEELKTKNAAVIESYTALSNARLERNKILYDDSTGLYAIALGVKNYVRALFNLNSYQYKQIKKIKFTTIIK